ncbi:MAG: acylphosphatase [Phycisphaerae bacterium]|nr:acylphosphatase [Phycisphaerae bacterium]
MAFDVGVHLMRKTLYYSGHVQGVGFRYTTARVAANYEVTGTVRNIADGRVEVIAEGQPDEVEMFLEALGERMSGFIRKIEQQQSPGTGQYRSFDICY